MNTCVSYGETQCQGISQADGKEQNHIEFSNRFRALEDLETKSDINSALETIRVIINISAKVGLGCNEL
jgi:hypothetical protein